MKELPTEEDTAGHPLGRERSRYGRITGGRALLFPGIGPMR
jgi:hypothetical protein